MPRYNFAYCPVNPDFAAKYIEYARQNFEATASDYLLNSANALPHVTLCQFESPEDRLTGFWKDGSGHVTPRRTLKLDTLNSRTSANRFWFEYKIVPDDLLKAEQTALAEFLQSQGAQIFTHKRDSYSPHMTMANSLKAQPIQNNAWPQSILGSPEQPFRLTVGLSSHMGVYLKQLYTV